jgi:hypothetical protein
MKPHFDRRLRRAFARDVQTAGLPDGPGDERVVGDADLAGFDAPVQRYLRFMGVVGRPRVWSFRVDFAGRFRMKPDGPWLPASAHQYNSVVGIARVFTMRLRFAGVVPMLGHDTYLGGRGRMHGKLAGIATVVDSRGPELDVGELSTWLNDAVLLAPSMLLAAPVVWSATADDAFDVTLEDGGHRVTASVVIDDRGAPLDFATVDRWAALPQGMTRARWRTPVPGWRTFDGRPFPQPGQAIWDLADGPFCYVEGGFVLVTFRANIGPDRAATA